MLKVNRVNGRYVLSFKGKYLASADTVSDLQFPKECNAAFELTEVCKRIQQSLSDTDAVRGTSHALELSKLEYVLSKV